MSSVSNEVITNKQREKNYYRIDHWLEESSPKFGTRFTQNISD